MADQVRLGPTVLRVLCTLATGAERSPADPVRLHDGQRVYLRAAGWHSGRRHRRATVRGRRVGLFAADPFAYSILHHRRRRLHLAVGDGSVLGHQVVQRWTGGAF